MAQKIFRTPTLVRNHVMEYKFVVQYMLLYFYGWYSRFKVKFNSIDTFQAGRITTKVYFSILWTRIYLAECTQIRPNVITYSMNTIIFEYFNSPTFYYNNYILMNSQWKMTRYCHTDTSGSKYSKLNLLTYGFLRI